MRARHHPKRKMMIPTKQKLSDCLSHQIYFLLPVMPKRNLPQCRQATVQDAVLDRTYLIRKRTERMVILLRYAKKVFFAVSKTQASKTHSTTTYKEINGVKAIKPQTKHKKPRKSRAPRHSRSLPRQHAQKRHLASHCNLRCS